MSRVAGRDELVVIAKEIHDDGHRPVYVYRMPPTELRGDSGWAATLGDGSDATPADVTTAHIGHLIDRWPELEAVFNDPRQECEWSWDSRAGAYVEGSAGWSDGES